VKKKKKTKINIFSKISVPKDIKISPVEFLSNTKKKIDKFYTDLKKTQAREKIKLEKKRKLEKIKEQRDEER